MDLSEGPIAGPAEGVDREQGLEGDQKGRPGDGSEIRALGLEGV